MATQMTDRLDDLYVAAIDREASLMHANAVSATARWCSPSTTHAQVAEFVERQIVSLEGLSDVLSSEIRTSWQWLAAQLGSAPMLAVPTQSSVGSARVLSFGRRERSAPRAQAGRVRTLAA